MIIDVILIGVVLSVTDFVLLKVFHSESIWLELGIYIVLYAVVFGIKKGIVILWNRFVSKNKKKGENDNEKNQ